MTDQQRADSLTRAVMPNLTRFRREGVTFTNSYTVSPHCCPARATFFTGLYPSQHGVWNNVKVSNALSRGFYEGVRLFSEDLKAAGYRMYFSGKWHASTLETPLDRGFDVLDEPVPKPGKHCGYVTGGRENRRTAIRAPSRGSGAFTATVGAAKGFPAARGKSSATATRPMSCTARRTTRSRTRTWWTRRWPGCWIWSGRRSPGFTISGRWAPTTPTARPKNT